MYQSQSVLLKEIDSMRKRMISSAHETGYTSVETIRLSHELDRLIFEYQTFCRHTAMKKQRRKFIFKKIIFSAEKQCGFAGA